MSTHKIRLVVCLIVLLFSVTNWLHAGVSKVTPEKKVLVFNTEGRLSGSFVLPNNSLIYAASQDLKSFYSVDQSGKSLSLMDSTNGVSIRSLAIGGAAVALAEDAERGRLFVLTRNPNRIQVLDTRSASWIDSYDLPDVPLSFAFDSRQDSIYVGFQQPFVSRISASNGRELSRITDVDASVKGISFDAASDRLVFLHEKHISVYGLSTEKFVNYLQLEAEPAGIRMDSARGNLYVLLRDEPDTVAVYSMRDLRLADWKNLKYRNYQGKKVDVSSLFVNSKSGDLSFVDAATASTFRMQDTTFAGPAAPSVIPPGYTPSPDTPINVSSDPGLVPSCEIDGFGNLLFTWMNDTGKDGSGEGSFARRFTPAMVSMENDFSVPANKVGDQGGPIIAGGDNDVVVVWRDGSDKDGDSFGVYGRVFDGTVAPMVAKTGDLLLPQTTGGRQMMPWVDMMANGDFIAAWSGKWNPAAGKRQTFTRRFDNTGAPLSDEALANTIVKGNTWAVQVDVNSTGGFVTVWRDDADNGIRGRAYDAAGNPVSASGFKVGPFKPGDTQTFAPSVAVREDGSFVVVYKENPAGGIVGENFDAAQNSLGMFVVTSQMTKSNDAPVIGMAQDGRFVVVWRDSGYPNNEVAARVFNADGTPNGNDFIVPEDPAGDEFEPAIAMDSVGNFVAVWKDRNRTPNIFGRYFSTGSLPAHITVTGITTATADRGTTADYTIQGDSFDGTATVDFNDPGIVVNSYGTITATSIDVNVTVQNTAFLGMHDVKVTVGTGSGTGKGIFEVKEGGAYPVPTVLAVTPPSGFQNSTLNVLIDGTDFANHPSLTADFGADITVNSIHFVSSVQISASITIAGSAATGLRNVSVSNPGPSTGSCTDCFDVIFNPVLFADDFGDGVADGWTPDKGSWTAATNALVGTQLSGKATDIATGFAGCSQCSVEADIRVGSGTSAKISLLGWYIDNQNYVELSMDKGDDKWTLKNRIGGDVVGKDSFKDSVDLVINTLYHVKMTYDGVNIQVYVRGGVTPVITLPATGISGTVGFRIKSTGGTIDNVQVNPFP